MAARRGNRRRREFGGRAEVELFTFWEDDLRNSTGRDVRDSGPVPQATFVDGLPVASPPAGSGRVALVGWALGLALLVITATVIVCFR